MEVPPNHPFIDEPSITSILIGFSYINHPFGATTIYGNPHICSMPGGTTPLPGLLKVHHFFWEDEVRNMKVSVVYIYIYMYV